MCSWQVLEGLLPVRMRTPWFDQANDLDYDATLIASNARHMTFSTMKNGLGTSLGNFWLFCSSLDVLLSLADAGACFAMEPKERIWPT